MLHDEASYLNKNNLFVQDVQTVSRMARKSSVFPSPGVTKR